MCYKRNFPALMYHDWIVTSFRAIAIYMYVYVAPPMLYDSAMWLIQQYHSTYICITTLYNVCIVIVFRGELRHYLQFLPVFIADVRWVCSYWR